MKISFLNLVTILFIAVFVIWGGFYLSDPKLYGTLDVPIVMVGSIIALLMYKGYTVAKNNLHYIIEEENKKQKERNELEESKNK